MDTVETWKDIPNCEGYQASDLGKIKSLSSGKLLLFRQKKSSGYYRVNLSVNGVHKTFSIHKLIALTFLDNPNNYNSINHINGDKSDNRTCNLEWCSIAHNNLHAYRVLGKVNPMQGKTGKLNPNSKPVICLNTDERFDNIREASEKFNVLATSIARVCKGINHKVGGLKFKYA